MRHCDSCETSHLLAEQTMENSGNIDNCNDNVNSIGDTQIGTVEILEPPGGNLHEESKEQQEFTSINTNDESNCKVSRSVPPSTCGVSESNEKEQADMSTDIESESRGKVSKNEDNVRKADIHITSPDTSDEACQLNPSSQISTLRNTENDTDSQTEACIDLNNKEKPLETEMELDMDPNATKNVTKEGEMNAVENDADILDQPIFWPYEFSKEFSTRSKLDCLATSTTNEFNGRILKGCKWAPDGSCLLSNSDGQEKPTLINNVLRVFNLPNSVYQVEDWNKLARIEEDVSWRSSLNVREGGQVYDFAWYPLMKSSDPMSSCFLSTACDGPVHLFDAFTGSLRASYTAYNNVEEVAAAYSVAFDPFGEYIYCGFNQAVKIFNITRPGRECTVRVLKHKVLPDLCQGGIISCIAINPTLNGVYACGSYRRTVGLYLNDGQVLCILEGHLGGVTHLAFSHDGSKLFTGGRKDSRLICWDMRNTGEEYQILERVADTNQRIYFDVTRNDRYLISGGTDGNVRLWDLSSPGDTPVTITASSDCVNGVSINPYVPILATASGQRHFQQLYEDMESDVMFVDAGSKRNAAQDIKLWPLV